MNPDSTLPDCRGCGATPGNLHRQGCDNEQCRLCGGQQISCDCVYADRDEDDVAFIRGVPGTYAIVDR